MQGVKKNKKLEAVFPNSIQTLGTTHKLKKERRLVYKFQNKKRKQVNWMFVDNGFVNKKIQVTKLACTWRTTILFGA